MNAASAFEADMPLADTGVAKWGESVLMQMQKGLFPYTIHHFPLVHDLHVLQQALSAFQISWDYTEVNTMCVASWSTKTDDRQVVYNGPEAAAAMVNALIAASYPHRVEVTEVSAFLSTKKPYIQDTIVQLMAVRPDNSHDTVADPLL